MLLTGISVTSDDILSYSPNWRLLIKAIAAINYRPPVNDIYEEIINHAIQAGNVNLVKESERIFGDKYEWLYLYYLQSPHPEGDKLASRYWGGGEMPDIGDAIGYRFGNRDILLKYIKRWPKRTMIAAISSFIALTEAELIDLLPWGECIDQYGLDEALEELDASGYDYLLNYVKENVIVCEEKD